MRIPKMRKILNSILISFFFLAVCSAQDQPALSAEQQAKKVFNDANQYYAQGNYEEAIRLYEEAIDLNPNFAPVFNNLGLAYKAVGADLTDVAWYFHAATEIDPQYVESYDNLGKAYYGMGDFENAEFYCKKALEIRPSFPSAELSLGWINLLGKSNPGDAIHYFKDVADKTNVANAYFGLGLAYFMNNERTMVLEVITKLREIDQEKLATQLEDIFRGHYFVPGQANEPLVNIPLQQQDMSGQVTSSGSFKIQPGPMRVPMPNLQGSTQVRLRGKIYNLKEKDYRKKIEVHRRTIERE